jgi:hypothetical protein
VFHRESIFYQVAGSRVADFAQPDNYFASSFEFRAASFKFQASSRCFIGRLSFTWWLIDCSFFSSIYLQLAA